MAIFRPGPIIGAISGNLGGSNFVQSNNGPVVRQRIRRTRLYQDRTREMRIRFQNLRAAWAQLETQEITQWRAAAADFPHTNRLGVTSRLSGYQLFMKVNAFAWNPSKGLAPDPISTPPNLNRQVSFTFDRFRVSVGFFKQFRAQEPIPSNNTQILIYGARTFSTSPRKSWTDFKFIEFGTLLATTLTINNWNSVIGNPEVGEQCWIKLWQRGFQILPTGPVILSAFAVA